MQRVFGAVNVMSFSSHYTKKRTNKTHKHKKRKNTFQDNGADCGLV